MADYMTRSANTHTHTSSSRLSFTCHFFILSCGRPRGILKNILNLIHMRGKMDLLVHKQDLKTVMGTVRLVSLGISKNE